MRNNAIEGSDGSGGLRWGSAGGSRLVPVGGPMGPGWPGGMFINTVPVYIHISLYLKAKTFLFRLG